MDVVHGLESMWSDIVELAKLDWVGRSALVTVLALPFVSLVLIIRGDRPAWLALGIWFALVAVWFLYYATDWWGPVGGPNGFWTGLLVLGIGWAIAVRQSVKELRAAGR